MPSDLHPAPADTGPVDHRDTPNRRQMRDRSTAQMIYKGVCERLASDLAISPHQAHGLLQEGADEVTRGTAWEWWT